MPGITHTPASCVLGPLTCARVSSRFTHQTPAPSFPGTILRQYLKNSPQQYTRIVYTGDGQNDLCPLLQLAEGDVGVARRGYGLDKALSQWSFDVKATVHVIDFLTELGNVIQSYC